MASYALPVSCDSDLKGEPSLDELMADPIMLLIMKRDGVKPQHMLGEISRLQAEWALLPRAV